jgi:heme exporter protein B
MSLSSRWHGLIVPIIILPLFLPVLIFGAGALSTLIFNGFEEVYIRQLFVLAGLSGLAIVFCPIISSYVIKVNFE